ncbi:MAG TPA: hypothetical protein VGR38_09550, partial [Candidatus Polarisedimenticolia bacterium]|nr:hypothetical protein [Candidatus Polarisedimenticolia bacterium]
MSRDSTTGRVLARIVHYTAIILATLLLADGVCILFDLFPPKPRYGDADLGWLRARPSEIVRIKECMEFSTGKTYAYERNEDGVRTAQTVLELLADHAATKIAVTGDSQTDLCVPNQDNHPGILEKKLKEDGIPAVVLPYPSGRYSPLQDYLAFKKMLRKYDPRVLVLDFYTGNDFLDLLRSDDRPHFVSKGSGYSIAS